MSKRESSAAVSRNRGTRDGDMLRLDLEAQEFDEGTNLALDFIEEVDTVAVLLQEQEDGLTAREAAAIGRTIRHATSSLEDYIGFLHRIAMSDEERKAHLRRALEELA